MVAEKLDGKLVASQVKAELAGRVAALKARGVTPGLGTVLVGDDPASHIYVAGKHRDCAQVGIESIQVELPADASAADVEAEVAALNSDPRCTGYIVQLPLPKQVDENHVLGLIDPDKDADGLTPANLGRLMLDAPGVLPCTPRGILEVLRRYDYDLAGKEVCVIGRGTTVGRPLATLLTWHAYNATVTVCHTKTRDLAAHTKRADVIVAAAGRAHMLTADMVSPGAAVIDVGVTRVDGKPVGDVDPGVWDVAGWMTPNPGGIGPMTRAMLLANVVDMAERANPEA